MLTLPHGLSRTELAAISDLEQRVLAVDGGRLKLEWPTLRARSGRRPEDVLAWQDDLLVGFLGTYAFGGATVELAGMVDPAARRRGVGSALLTAGLELCGGTALLVVPRSSGAGAAFALARARGLSHSEHALVLTGPPAPGPADPGLELRPARPDDVPAIAALLAAGFGSAPDAPQVVRRLADTRVAVLDGRIVATLRVERDGDTGAVCGFVVAPALQGRGLGRDLLRRVCGQLASDGAARVALEVATDNEHALGLYTSLGFAPVATEDYYAVAAVPRPGAADPAGR